jgi:hypothetical protein
MSGRFSVPLRWQPGYRSVTLPRIACRLAAAALRREAAQGHTAAKSLKASSASWVFVDPNEALSVDGTVSSSPAGTTGLDAESGKRARIL